MVVSPGNSLSISVSGKTLEFKMNVENEFHQKHGRGKPPIQIKTIGVPLEFFKEENEADTDYRKRLEKLYKKMEDEYERKKFEKGYEESMRATLTNYQQHLAQYFDIERANLEVFTQYLVK